MKKFLIRCDMEGISGIVSYEQADPSMAEYSEGRRYFMSDLNAIINGLYDGGADEVHVYDEHFYGRNVIFDMLDHKEVVLYCGKPPYRKDWAGGLDKSFDGLILLGFHSKRGTENALLNHSYEPDIRDICINGVSVGEIGVEAAIAGDFNVPVAMLVADSEGISEAKKLLKGVSCVCVKESYSEFGAKCYSLKKTYNMIYQAARLLAEQGSNAEVYRCGNNVKFEFTFFDTPYAAKYRELFGEPVIEGKTALECWAKYWKNKLEVNHSL